MQLRCNHRHKRSRQITWIILLLSHLNVTLALASVKISSTLNQPGASASITPPKQSRHASFRTRGFSPSIADYYDDTADPSLSTLISETSSSDERSSTGTDVEYLPATRPIIPTSTRTLLTEQEEEESFSAPLNLVADAVPLPSSPSSPGDREYYEEPSEVLYGIQSSQSSDIEPTTTTAFQLLLIRNETAYSDQSSEDLSISEPTGTNLINSETTRTNLIFETTATDLNYGTRRADRISNRIRTIPISGISRINAVSDTIRTIPIFDPTRTDLNSEASRISKRTRSIRISRTTRTVDAISDTTFEPTETEAMSERIRTVLIFEPTRTLVNSETTDGNIPISETSRSDDVFAETTNINLVSKSRTRVNLNSEFTRTVPMFESASSTDGFISESTTTDLLFEATRTNLISESAGNDVISERTRTQPAFEITGTRDLISENTRSNLFSEIVETDPISDRSRTGLISESTRTDINFETTGLDSISEASRTRPISPSRTNKVMTFDSTATSVQSSSIDSEDYQTAPLRLEDEEFPLFDDSNSTQNFDESSYTSGTESSFFILPSASFPEDASELLLKSTVVLESSVSSFLFENSEREFSSSIESLKIVSSPTYFNIPSLTNNHSSSISDISPTSSTYFFSTSSGTTNINNNHNNNVNFGRDLSSKVPENVIHPEVNPALVNTTEEMKENPVVETHHQVHQELVLNEDPGVEHKPYLNNTVDKRFDPEGKVMDVINTQTDEPKNESNDSKTTSSLSFRTASVDFKTISVTSPMFTQSSVFTRVIENSSEWLLSSVIPSAVATIYQNISEAIDTTTQSGGDFTVISPSRTIITEEPLITKFTTLQSHNEDKSGSIHPSEKQSVMPTVLIPTAYLSVSIRTSWSHLCANQFQYQKMFAKHLSVAAKASIAETQIVFFNINECNQVSLNAEPDNAFDENGSGTKHLYVYVRDRRGTFSKTLTQLLGNIILKLKEYGELKDVVVGVQLHHKGDHVEQHQPQASDTHSKDMGIVAAITISCIAGVCLMLLCVLLVVLKRRHGVQQQRRCRPVTDAYSLESISIYSSFRKRKMRASKRSYLNQGFDDPSAPTNRLNFAHLAQYTTDENAITEEYKQIPMTMAKLGEMPSGADVKNRYANVIPFPETRVLLSPNPEVNGSDYINANYVRGFQGKPKYYIACQAPLDITIVDFWQMIWENQCKVILMLTNWDENGVPKCAQYFSESNTVDNHRLFGDYQITTKRVDVREFYTITYLQLKNLEKNLQRDVIHHWYTAWPAQGVPTEKVSILEMLLEARASIKSNPGPTVVHCSPGTGRTGTVLAIDICMQEFETKRTVDVPRCVYHLRRDRGGLVQTTEQYLFIYEVLNEFACRVLNQSGRSSVRSSR